MAFPQEIDWSGQNVVTSHGSARRELELLERIEELERTLKALRASYEERGEVIRLITQSSFD